MSPAARYAILIALTNVPEGDDWSIIERIAKLFLRYWPKSESRKIKYLIRQRETHNIPDLIKLISIDNDEYNHLMTCLYKNGLARGLQGDQGNEEIHETEEYWELDEMEAKGLEKFYHI